MSRRQKTVCVGLPDPLRVWATVRAAQRGQSLSAYITALVAADQSTQSMERLTRIEARLTALAHDDGHASGEINDAAIAYAWAAAKQARGESLTFVKNAVPAGAVPVPWPWEDAYWKPSHDPIRNLVKAGALIAAEIDRLLRAQARKEAR